MKQIVIFFTALGVGIFLFTNIANAQMMGNFQPSVTPSPQDLKDIQTGKDLYNKFQNKEVSCNQLKNDDFEKIGEYIMDQNFGNTNSHIQMNERAKQMMGEKGEEQMHSNIAKSTLGCTTNGQGGVTGMMGWGYGGMMNGGFGWGFGVLGFLFWLVLFVDFILLGIWLWKQIKK